MSLGSFLQTHPYKRKDCLEHICKTLKLSTNGIVETLRSRIIDYAEGKSDMEEQIKQIAQKYKSIENKKHKTSVSNTEKQSLPPLQPSPPPPLISPRIRIIQSASHSTPCENIATQPPLFEDTQNLPPTTGSIFEEIDDFYHELTLNGDEDVFPGVMEAKRRRLQSPFTHIDESLWYDDSAHSQSNNEDVITRNQCDSAHTQIVDDEIEGIQDKFRDNSEKRLAFLIDQAVKMVEAKDRQIESLKDEIARLVNVTGDLIKGHEEGMKRMTEESGITNVLVNDLVNEVKTQRVEISKLQQEISLKGKLSEPINPSANKSTTSSDVPPANAWFSSERHSNERHTNERHPRERHSNERHSNERHPNERHSNERHSNEGHSNTRHTGANHTRASHKQVPALATTTTNINNIKGNNPKPKQAKEHVLLITDSNGKALNLGQLKPEAHVTRACRYTTKQATDSIPQIADPTAVTDIVFQVGLNDVRHYSEKAIQEKYLEMQMTYRRAFSTARQHITAIPPLQETHKNLNSKLQKLSQHTESNFISTKRFLDQKTGQIRANLMDGIHYNDWGIKMIAKEMKKSLYSNANRDSTQLSRLCQNNTTQPATPPATLSATPPTTTPASLPTTPSVNHPNLSSTKKTRVNQSVTIEAEYSPSLLSSLQ